MADDSLHQQSPEDEPLQKTSAASEPQPHRSSQQGYPPLTRVAAGDRPAVRRRLSLNWVLLLLVIVVWSVAIGLYLSSFPAIPSAPLVAMEQPVAETRLPVPRRVPVQPAPLASGTGAADLSAPEAGSTPTVPGSSGAPAAEKVAEPVYRLTIGPFIDGQAQQQAVEYLTQQDMTAEQMKGEGAVHMIRLFAGSYLTAEAEQQLRRLQAAVPSAFTLPDNGRRALYAASFQSRDRADAMQKTLAEGGISVTPQVAAVTMTGTLLVIEQVDQQEVNKITSYFADSGIRVQSEQQQP